MAETKAVPIPEEFQLMDRYWKASNYLAVGQVRSKIGKDVSEERIFLTHNTRFSRSTDLFARQKSIASQTSYSRTR
jgi:phosphoketolase